MAIFPPYLQYSSASELIDKAHIEFLSMISLGMYHDSCPVNFLIRNSDTSKKSQAFLHLTTMKHSAINKRILDKPRAKRIHWIKNLIDDYPHPKIEFYRKYYGTNIRLHFIVPEYAYFLVIEESKNSPKSFFVISAYHLDNDRQISYQMKNVRDYIKNNYLPLE
jgi:hypothetical protein